MNYLYYLNKPWVLGHYECWAMVCDFYKTELDIELPLINLGTTSPTARRKALADNEVYPLFSRKLKPKHGDVVAMCEKMDVKKIFSHVGVYLDTPDGNKIMHSSKSHGTLIQDPSIIDCGIICYWRYKNA